MSTNSDWRTDFAIRGLLLLASSLICLLLAVLLPDGKPFAAQGFNWYVNASQNNLLSPRIAYLVFCILLGVAAFCFHKFHSQISRSLIAQSKISAGLIALCSLIFGFCSICFYGRDLSISVATVVLLFLAVTCMRALPPKATNVLAFALALSAFLAAALPGLFEIPNYSTQYPESIADIESHQALSTAADQRLAQGHKLFETVGMRYGVLWQSILAAVTKYVKPLSVGDGIMFTRWLHSTFFLLAGLAYLRFSRSSPTAACLAVLFIAPWMELRQMLFIFPQVTAWRYFCFALVPLLVMMLENIKSCRLRAAILGGVCALSLLADWASGASITAGMAVYLLFRREKAAQGKSIVIFSAGLFISIVVFLGIFAGAFGYLPSAKAFISQLKLTAWDCAGGTAPALGYEFDPLAILILLHTAYAAIKLFSRGPACLSSRDALRLALCVTSLLWFVHYVNEPNTFALRACRVLYGFFLVDLLRTLILAWKRKRELAEPLWLLNLLLVAVLIPAACVSYKPAANFLYSKAQPAGQHNNSRAKMLVSGVYLSPEVGTALVEKADFIRAAAASAPIMYITADSSFVPKLSGVSSLSPLSDPYSELIFAKQSEAYVRAVEKLQPKKIYVDSPDFITAKGVARLSCLEFLRVLLRRSYTLKETRGGWQIWEQNTACVAAPEAKKN